MDDSDKKTIDVKNKKQNEYHEAGHYKENPYHTDSVTRFDPSVKRKAFYGILYGKGLMVYNEFTAFVMKVVLARLLLPEHFGIVAMCFLFLSVFNLFSSFGVHQAIMPAKKKIKEKADTAHFIVFWLHVLVFLVAFFSAPLAAKFFDYEGLTWMIRALSFTIIMGGFGSVPALLLTKNLDYDKSAKKEFIAQTLYLVTTVTLAFLGFEAWSMIIGSLIAGLVRTVLAVYYSYYKPKLKYHKDVAKGLLLFGKDITLTSIIHAVMEKGDDTILGKVLGSASLGFYTLGNHAVGIAGIANLAGGVFGPLFAKYQDNKKLLKKIFLKGIRLKSIFTIPGYFGMFILADEVVRHTFGIRWMAMVPLIRILLILPILTQINSFNGTIFIQALGKPYITRNINIVKTSVFILVMYPAVKYFGLEGAGIALFLIGIAGNIASTIYFIRFGFGDFYKSALGLLAKFYLSSIIMAFGVYYMRIFFLYKSSLLNLILLVAIGVLVYLGIIFAIDKDAVNDVRSAFDQLKQFNHG